ncbi:hypothetical protein [uncultured Roseibium sp.]|uniref:hypothetical protein n=1 Tax=uncultured Roseibium sp. TaxID=1936171 RepID=UPI003216D3C4
MLEFDSAVFADFASLMAAATDDGTDMTITIDAETSILLQNVVVAEFHQDDVRIV